MNRVLGVVPLLLCPLALLNGQMINGKYVSGGDRFVVDTNVVCHSRPTADTTTPRGLPLGTFLPVTRETQADGTIWYFDAGATTGEHPSCWVFGPNTALLDVLNPDRLRLAILDHILAREEVKLDEYVEVENFLTENNDSRFPSVGARIPGLLRFRLLQVLDRALQTTEMQNVGGRFGGEPLKRAWVLRHSDLFVFDEPGAEWYVEPGHYWELFEANRNEPWAEELAWYAASLPTHTDECYSNCVLQQLVDRPLQYWTRYPVGPHIAEALSRGADRAHVAAEGACERTSPEIKEQTTVPRERLTEIRTSLTKVTHSGKEPILKSLVDIEQKCRR
jgi:hypothetical protein